MQSYVRFGRNQGILDLMTAWTAENLDRLNAVTVLQTGDLVQHNNVVMPSARSGNQSSVDQWASVSRAFERLDHRTPYVVATGNHDYGTTNAQTRETQFPQFFPVERNPRWADVLVEMGPHREAEPNLANAAYAFKTPTGVDLLVLSLEFGPSDPAIEWAQELLAREAFADHFVILLTHAYMRSHAEENALIDTQPYPLQDVNYGEALWERLIYPSDTIRLVICGHIAGPDNNLESVGYRMDANHAGQPVAQMLFNAQANGGGWRGNGGDGWLRILEFSEDASSISVRTFSPFFAISPSTRHLAWRTAPEDQFVINFEATE